MFFTKQYFMSLSDKEIDQLFRMIKRPLTRASVKFPLHREKVVVELEGTGRITFQADINRNVGLHKINKASYQLRHRKTIKIRRMDLRGNHTNPEGPAPNSNFEGYEGREFLEEDHVHFYIKGYDSRWAIPLSDLPEIDINNSDTMLDKLVKFFNYCNIINLEIDQDLTLF